MRKRFISLALCLAMTLALCIPCAAAETAVPKVRDYAGFTDVPEGSWCHEAVKLCYEAGLINGTSAAAFSPDGSLTYEQLVVLTARLHHILNGGDGVLPAAPEDFGTITFTAADGSPAPFTADDIVGYGWGGGIFDITLHDGVQSRLKTGAVYTMTTVLEKTYTLQGTVQSTGRSLVFPISDSDPDYYRLMSYGYTDPIPAWILNAVAYAWQEDLPIYGSTLLGTKAYRSLFAEMLAICLTGQELTPINHIQSVPDLTTEGDACMEDAYLGVLDLYNAGILTGADRYGTLYGARALTRAQAAVMLARVLDPALRVRFTPDTPAWQLSYTLERLPESYQETLHTQEYRGVTAFWSDLTAIKTWDEQITFFYTNGEPLRNLPENHPGRVWLEQELDWFHVMLPGGSHQEDPSAAGYYASLTASYVDGAAPAFFPDQAAIGYYSQEGRILIPPRFLNAGALVDGVSIVQCADGDYYRLKVAK